MGTKVVLMTGLTRAGGLPSAVVAVLLLSAAGALVLAMNPGVYPELHTILDSAVAVLSGVLALLLWDMEAHTKSSFVKWLSVGFGLTFALDMTHVLASIDWGGILSARAQLRPATWSPSAYLLPIAAAGALWRLSRRGEGGVAGFAGATAILAALLVVAFQQFPAYAQSDLLGMTRPTLVAVPVLWLTVAAWAWVLRDRHRLAPPLVWAAAALFVGHTAILYSNSPSDAEGMIAHIGKIAGYLALLLWVMTMASQDMRDRITAESALADLNADLDRQVAQRTSDLLSAHETLERESSQRQRADSKALDQLARLSLLQQITRAIGDRQDLHSIFQVAVRSVEAQLPVDFACLCTYDAAARRLTVAAVGANNPELGQALAGPGAVSFDVDENHLTQCIQGVVLYEPDISAMEAPFQGQLALSGLQSLVATPLQVESKAFGCFIAARRGPGAFGSADCEFLRQLGEHIALAAHQVELHSALQAAYDDLRQTQQSVAQQERLRALGQMASGIAHDINNALSPVALYTEAMLETEKGLSPTARNQLEVIRRAVEDVSHTIGRMREFYREREPQLPGAPLQLNELARHVLDLTRPRWADMSMQRGAVVLVETDLAQNLPLVLGAESEIREALTNLVFNAIDAMPDGGTLTLRTAPADEPGWVRIDVADSGVGMDAEARRRCMEPFFTTKGERGTGLGLAMVFGVAQRHGAEVDIQSVPGEGTTFSLIFPTAMRDAAKGGAEPEAPPPMRLLLVDDDPVLLKALSDALGNDGHKITSANDGQAGIDAFVAGQDGFPFDAVITDLGMPYINGRQVAAAIKSTSPETPVILLTGWGQGMLSGVEGIPNVDLVLGKPPKLREVRAALARQYRKAAE